MTWPAWPARTAWRPFFPDLPVTPILAPVVLVASPVVVAAVLLPVATVPIVPVLMMSGRAVPYAVRGGGATRIAGVMPAGEVVLLPAGAAAVDGRGLGRRRLLLLSRGIGGGRDQASERRLGRHGSQGQGHHAVAEPNPRLAGNATGIGGEQGLEGNDRLPDRWRDLQREPEEVGRYGQQGSQHEGGHHEDRHDRSLLGPSRARMPEPPRIAFPHDHPPCARPPSSIGTGAAEPLVRRSTAGVRHTRSQGDIIAQPRPAIRQGRGNSRSGPAGCLP